MLQAAPGWRRTNSALLIPQSSQVASGRDPSGEHVDSEVPFMEILAQITRAKESIAPKLRERRPPQLPFNPGTAGPFTVASSVNRLFHPEVGFLMPRSFGQWDQDRITAPERSWPVAGSAAELYDHQREGQPAWKPGRWSRMGGFQACDANPSPRAESRGGSRSQSPNRSRSCSTGPIMMTSPSASAPSRRPTSAQRRRKATTSVQSASIARATSTAAAVATRGGVRSRPTSAGPTPYRRPVPQRATSTAVATRGGVCSRPTSAGPAAYRRPVPQQVCCRRETASSAPAEAAEVRQKGPTASPLASTLQ